MHATQRSARFAVPLMIATLLVSFSFSAAQDVPQAGSQSAGQTPRQSQPGGVMIDPSAGPLKPSEPPLDVTPAATPLPETPQPKSTPAPMQQQSSQQAAPPEPVGAAAAEQVKTAGGGASRPAGNAIAPARQHQYRSLVIKLGALAAGAIAVGTVYGLSKATPSTPPHSASPAPAVVR
jgi:hypothetical protein